MANEFHVRSLGIPGTSYYHHCIRIAAILHPHGGAGRLQLIRRASWATGSGSSNAARGDARLLGGSRPGSLESSSGEAVGFIFLSLKLCRSSYFSGRMIPRFLTLVALLWTIVAHRTQAETNANLGAGVVAAQPAGTLPWEGSEVGRFMDSNLDPRTSVLRAIRVDAAIYFWPALSAPKYGAAHLRFVGSWVAGWYSPGTPGQRTQPPESSYIRCTPTRRPLRPPSNLPTTRRRAEHCGTVLPLCN